MLNSSSPRLTEVRSAFDAWRQRGRPRITPEELRRQAVQVQCKDSCSLQIFHEHESRSYPRTAIVDSTSVVS